STISAFNYYDAVSATSVDAARIYNVTSSTATTGSVQSGYAVVTQLATPGGPGAIVNLKNSGVPEIATSFNVDVNGAKASTAAILWLGANQLNVSLGTLAPGCTLYASYDAILGVVSTSAAGSGSLTLGVPNNTALIGVKFYNQYMVLDAGANTLGLVFSNGGAGKIGG
ncbi:MAG: hypothetical protein KDC95_24765, partial [Planctomycetes bacterium]|nr:hypothetical protein [Planctomycetota bacterium]